MEEAPARFTIRPDDYHVPYAGTAEDGRRFFLTEELFSDTSAWVGLFLWTAGGQFDEVRVSAAGRAPRTASRAGGTRRSGRTRASPPC